MIIRVEKFYHPEKVNVLASYFVTYENGEVWSVPLDEANTDYQAIQEWIADGGTVIDNGGSE